MVSYTSAVHVHLLLWADLVQFLHTTDVSMRIVSVPGGQCPPGPLVSASAHVRSLRSPLARQLARKIACLGQLLAWAGGTAAWLNARHKKAQDRRWRIAVHPVGRLLASSIQRAACASDRAADMAVRRRKSTNPCSFAFECCVRLRDTCRIWEI